MTPGGESVEEGLIPAHAGKTRSRPRSRAVPGAHPRSRGENSRPGFELASALGSSPLTRGKPHRRIQGVVARRLIPAHAGKTDRRRERRECLPAHPRSRGENVRPAARGVAYDGSSPLTRGKLRFRSHVEQVQGLIPAHAGKTLPGERSHLPRGAHPRSRGENIQTTVQTVAGWGSSPLTRGKLVGLLGRRLRAGLIPAHAGKTHTIVWTSLPWRAHPRSRGENVRVAHNAQFERGSSPLTRGKRRVRARQELHHGLIPAHAGKTHGGDSAPPVGEAHPRSRGENTDLYMATTCYSGSSPLTRGKQC